MHQMHQSKGIFNAAAVTIQRHWRTFQKRQTAARLIQRLWKRYTNRAIFKCLKDVVFAQNRGDPRLLLRFLNYRESTLVDPASGLHVRFRLGGEHFPPKLYYKIFTHRPVTDICTFCPRNYVKEYAKEREHADSKEFDADWYNRQECNPWREVQYLTLQQSIENRKTEFVEWRYFSREKRALVKKRQIERRKQAWFQFPEPLDEVQDLISWSEALDFEQYLKTWNETGCSDGPQEPTLCFT